MPQLDDNPAFLASAEAVIKHFEEGETGPAAYEVLSLFDSELPVAGQAREIGAFVKSRPSAKAILIYYVGHGGFLRYDEYYLVLRDTHEEMEDLTGLRTRSLEILLRGFRGASILILDSCFAGAAVREFQTGGVGLVVAASASRPMRGTAMLVAASRDDPAITPHGHPHTIFCEALLRVLRCGIPTGSRYLTLEEVGDEAREWISQEYSGTGVALPEVHVPRQTDGNVSRMPLFANPAYNEETPEPVATPVAFRRSRQRIPFSFPSAVELRNVSIFSSYGYRRISNVSVNIRQGEFVGVVGQSGSGRSSLISLLLGNLQTDDGTVVLAGQQVDPENAIRLARRLVRYVDLGKEAIYPVLTVAEVITSAALLRFTGVAPKELHDRIAAVEDEFSISSIMSSRFLRISSYQRRAAVLAAELIDFPPIVVLNEPTDGLDAAKAHDLMARIEAANARHNFTVILFTHNLDHLKFVDRVFLMRSGGWLKDAGHPEEALVNSGKSSWTELLSDFSSLVPANDLRPYRPKSKKIGPPPSRSMRGFATLLKQQIRLELRRPPAAITLMVLIPFLLSLLAVMSSKSGLRPGPSVMTYLAILVTGLALSASWMTYAQLVVEDDVLRRQWRNGTDALPLLVAKLCAMTGWCAVLTTCAVALSALRPLPDTLSLPLSFTLFWAILFMVTIASACFGYFISAISSTLPRALSWNLMLTSAQVFLSGAFLPMPAPVGYVYLVLPTRLGIAAVASFGDLGNGVPLVQKDTVSAPGAGHTAALIAALVVLTATLAWASLKALEAKWER